MGLLDNSPRGRQFTKANGTLTGFSHTARHALSMRACDVRALKFANCFLMQGIEGEGPHECYFLVAAHDNSKAVRDGTVYYSAAMRHAETPVMCLQFRFFLTIFEYFKVFGHDIPEWRPSPANCDDDTEISVTRDTPMKRDFYQFYLFPCLSRGQTNLRKPMSDTTMYQHAVFAHKNTKPPLSCPKKCHLERGVSLRLQIRAGVSEQQVGRHGYFKQYTALNHNYLTDIAYEAVRQINGYPKEKGHYFQIRNVLRPPDKLTRAVFDVLIEPYDALMNSDDFDSGLMDRATTQFIGPLKYGACILCQDLAVLYDNMREHSVFSTDPFKDDSCGFFTFRSELLGAMKDEGINRMRATGDVARARGDVKCAEFADRALSAVLDILRENGLLRDGAAQSRAAHQPSTMQLDRFSTPVRHIREIHEVCVRGAGTLVPAVAAPCLAPRSDASHLAATPPSTPPRPPHGSLPVGRPMETAPAPLFDHLCLPAVNDPHTWPKDPDALPAFTKSVQLCTPRTIQDLADEWFRGIRGGAPIKFLEEFYGTRKRSGKSKYSWRSPKHRSDAFKKAYNTRSIFSLSLIRGADRPRCLRGGRCP